MDKVKGILSEGDYAELSKDLSAECDRLERSAAEGRKKVKNWKLRPKRTAAAESGPGGT